MAFYLDLGQRDREQFHNGQQFDVLVIFCAITSIWSLLCATVGKHTYEPLPSRSCHWLP